MKTDFNLEPKPISVPPPAPAQTLADLPPGSQGIVVSVDQAGSISRRLQDLGLLPNTPVKVLRRAPLGDPVVYELRGYRLCLRRGDAARVRVRPDEGDSTNSEQ